MDALAALVRVGKAGLDQLAVLVALCAHGVGQRVEAVRGVAEAEAHDHLRRDAAPEHVVLPALAGGSLQRFVEIARRGPVQREKPVALQTPVAVGIVLRDLHPRPPREELHRVREGEVLDLHDEVDDAAALAAAEAVIDLLVLVDGEAGRLLAVEGAEAEQVRPAAFGEPDIGAHHVHNVVPVGQLLEERVGKLRHARSPPLWSISN